MAFEFVMKEELGNDWLQPGLFRIGASSLLADIERQLDLRVLVAQCPKRAPDVGPEHRMQRDCGVGLGEEAADFLILDRAEVGHAPVDVLFPLVTHEDRAAGRSHALQCLNLALVDFAHAQAERALVQQKVRRVEIGADQMLRTRASGPQRPDERMFLYPCRVLRMYGQFQFCLFWHPCHPSARQESHIRCGRKTGKPACHKNLIYP